MASDRIQRRIERLLDQIEQEADQRNWQLVLELSKEVLGFAPDNHDAKAFLSVAEERLSDIPGPEAQEANLPTAGTNQRPWIAGLHLTISQRELFPGRSV